MQVKPLLGQIAARLCLINISAALGVLPTRSMSMRSLAPLRRVQLGTPRLLLTDFPGPWGSLIRD